MMYLILIVGMLFLVKGADFFVDGSASVAKILKVPSLIIGLTIVALGTSLPEASVSITAGMAGNNELALSNVVGSNIFNTLVVVGCSAMIAPFVMHRDIVKRDLIINLIVSVALCAFMFDGVLSRLDGILLLIGLVAFMLILIRSALRYRVEEETVEALPIGKSIILIIIGVAAIILGGNFVVSGASDIARQWGMSDTLIGLTIVSIGTSLPELVTSVVAARKGESSLSLGNAIGSNILNILFILGISGTLTPIAVIPESCGTDWGGSVCPDSCQIQRQDDPHEGCGVYRPLRNLYGIHYRKIVLPENRVTSAGCPFGCAALF